MTNDISYYIQPDIIETILVYIQKICINIEMV